MEQSIPSLFIRKIPCSPPPPTKKARPSDEAENLAFLRNYCQSTIVEIIKLTLSKIYFVKIQPL